MSYYLSFYSTILYGLYTTSNILSLKYYGSFPFFATSTVLYFTLQYELIMLSHRNKKLYLVRGFPGCGKTKYIEDKFLEKEEITLFDNYDLKSSMRNLYLQKERRFMELFNTLYRKSSIFQRNNTIVLTGFFPDEDSISNIRYLCKLFDYKLIIVSFDSADKDEAKYLLENSSIKKLNRSYIMKNSDNYQDTLIDDSDDYDEIFVANFNDCEGDSFPSPKRTMRSLDIELEEISKEV